MRAVLRRELQNRGVKGDRGTITIGSGEDDDTKRIAVALPGRPA
jgi:hypothetical protein